uniref:uncharacterized protein LOC128932113 isoform X3 n=1 Tax=Callithrix jacchus TaxID=9483 RepID=UPI0023DD53BB|nr:uncharacterized protein LOC128932113 isoform X3 [Callithrix jacchus]XP_054112005.1 uncharacterized protein LOC128932113 isoform X3 [Callithrix jacchus]
MVECSRKLSLIWFTFRTDWNMKSRLIILIQLASNWPSFLAAALARATSDEVLQSDLSALYIPKETDGTEGTVVVRDERIYKWTTTRPYMKTEL